MVLTGSSKGVSGQVLRIFPEKNKAIVEGVNMVKKHTKPNAENPQGGISEMEAAIHISNLAIVDPKEKKASRIGYEIKDGVKTRIAKKSGKPV